MSPPTLVCPTEDQVMYLIHVGQFAYHFLCSDMRTPARDHLKALGATPGPPNANSVPPARSQGGGTIQLLSPLILDAATDVEFN